MSKAHVKIQVFQNCVLQFDPDEALPKPIPDSLISKLRTPPTYKHIAGHLSFDETIYMAWCAKFHQLSKEDEKLLSAGGWLPHQRCGSIQVWRLDDEEIEIPSATHRPENWPPPHLKILETGTKTHGGTRQTPHVDFVSVIGGPELTKRWGFFATQDQYPVLPFRLVGQTRLEGWEIPMCYAVDANGQCWMDSTHGPDLGPVEASELLSNLPSEADRNTVRTVLGMKRELPSWVSHAKAAGWTPPKDWDESNYEKC